MEQTIGLPAAETTLADSLLSKVANLVEVSTSKYDLIEKLGAELGLGNAKSVWFCARHNTAVAAPIGDASCVAVNPKRETHRRSTHGCGYRVLIPSKIA